MIPPKQHQTIDRKNDILLDPHATAALVGGTKPLSVGTLAVWRSTKRYNLKYVKVGRWVRYWHSDVMLFIREREQSPQ
jgi:hypothetical protein